MPFEDELRPVFMISVAAELAEMHPQTLRMYERRGLIRPSRSSKSTRLYSLADVERLRRIQQLVAECGLNLAGVERVLEMEEQLESLQRRLDELQADMDRLAAQARDELEAVHRSYRKELVPLSAPGADHRASRTSGAAAGELPEETPATLPGATRAAVRQPSQPADHGHLQRLRQAPLPRLHGLLRRRHQVQGLRPDAALRAGDAQAGQARPGHRRRSGERPSRWVSPTTTSWAACGFFFLFIFVAAGIGYLVGEAVSRVSGRFHGLADGRRGGGLPP